MPRVVAMKVTRIDKDGSEWPVAELDENEALDFLDHIDAQYEAYRRAHPEENLGPLPPGEWEQYLDWAIQRQQQGEQDHA